MILIDGSEGEGGGQILRTSVALSAATGKPVKVCNIRAKRDVPGLRPQHLHAVKAVADLCDAEVSGLYTGSSEIVFKPGEVRGGRFSVDVGTAGSAVLVMQAFMFPAMYASEKTVLRVSGGTDVIRSPTADYLKHVTLKVFERFFGYRGNLEIKRRGYYPAGGGVLELSVEPIAGLKEVCVKEAGSITSVGGVSHAHKDLASRSVAERQAKSARIFLYNRLAGSGVDVSPDICIEYCDTLSHGSGLTLYAVTENSVIGSDSLGSKGRRAEEVGREAAAKLVDVLQSKAALDPYMGDQVVPYLAVAGGCVSVSSVSLHASTNIDVVNRFGFRVRVDGCVLCADKV